MADLNLDLNYFDHPKTKRLIGLLKRGSEVLPIRLWAYCGRVHPKDGRLTGYAVEEIESIVGWWGEAGRFVDTMLAVGFLEKRDDGYQVHDWAEHQGHLWAYHIRAKKAAKGRWSKMAGEPPGPPDASGNASSMQQASLKQCPSETNVLSQPTPARKRVGSVAEMEGDDLDAEVKAYITNHPKLPVWDPSSHAKCRQLIESVGWPTAKEFIKEAIAKGKPAAIGWALGKATGKWQQAGAVEANGAAKHRQSVRKTVLDGKV